MNIELLMINVMFVLLAIAAFFDIVWKHFVPVIIPALGIAARILELCILESDKLKELCIISIMLFVLLLGMAFLGNLGGADCLIGTMCGLYIGFYALMGMMIAFMLAIPYTLQMKLKGNEKEYAFVPYILLGMLIVVILRKGVL